MAFGFGMGFPRNEPFAGGPTLNLQFAGSTTLDPRITFARADATTCATYFDSAGVLRTATANTPRFDYDPSTLAPRGLLIEESRANLLLQSRDMTQAAWTKTDVTPTRNQVGIDGVANTACLLTEGSAGTASVIQSGSVVTAGSTITVSLVLKRGNTDWVFVRATEGTSASGATGWFNLNTGAKGAVIAFGAGTSPSSAITQIGGGWYRCTVTCVPDATFTTPQIQLRSASADGSSTRVPNATYIVDCAQLEVGAFATSIIPTTTTSLTRAQDNASMTGASFSSWYNASAGTFVVEAIQGPNDGASNRRIFQVSDGSASNVLSLTRSAGGLTQFTSYVANVGDFISAAGAPAQGAVTKGAIAYATSDKAVVRDGGTAATGTVSPPLTGMNQMQIGSVVGGGSATFSNTWIRRMTYYPRRLSNAELQATTS